MTISGDNIMNECIDALKRFCLMDTFFMYSILSIHVFFGLNYDCLVHAYENKILRNSYLIK